MNKYYLLETGDVIEKGDEYYDPENDKWEEVDPQIYGLEQDCGENLPIRRKLNV